MKSSLPKVMHEIGNLPLVGHVMRAALAAGCDRIAVVAGPGHEATVALAKKRSNQVETFEQTKRLGTAHAVLAARKALEKHADDVIVLFGDTPFMSARSIAAMRAELAAGASVVVGGMRPDDPSGYGRLIEDGGTLVAIREHQDASETERAIGFCNGGIMAFDGKTILTILDRIGDSNAQGEFYLTDAVEVAGEAGLKAIAIELPVADLIGINDRIQLADAEARVQASMRENARRDGATLIDPDNVYVS